MKNRIQLKKLLNLTEQSPQPPVVDPLAQPSTAALPPPAVPSGGMNAGQTQAAPPDTSPEPEDPSEYDFTKDFRAFEDKKNKAESEAKKVLLDQMNDKILNKTIVANASRGYGQPKTDYTIENIKKVSVEFWYKDYVVIVTDENDKKYFLTPGINIKIEGGGSEPAPAGQEAPETGQETPEPPQTGQLPTTAEKQPVSTSGSEEESPNNISQGQPQGQTVQPEQPQTVPATGEPDQPTQQELPKKKKKKTQPSMTEWVLQKDLNKFLNEYMFDGIKDENGSVNYIPYVSEKFNILTENKNVKKIKYKLLIPENHMVNPLDIREIKLVAIDTLRENMYYGEYSRGSVDIFKNGKYYLLEYVKETGWKD